MDANNEVRFQSYCMIDYGVSNFPVPKKGQLIELSEEREKVSENVRFLGLTVRLWQVGQARKFFVSVWSASQSFLFCFYLFHIKSQIQKIWRT